MIQAPQPIPQETQAGHEPPRLRLVIESPRRSRNRLQRELLLSEEIRALDPQDPLFRLCRKLRTRDLPVSHAVVRYRDHQGRVRQMVESWAPGWLVPPAVLGQSGMRRLKRWLLSQAGVLGVQKVVGEVEEFFRILRKPKLASEFHREYIQPKRAKGDPYRFWGRVWFDDQLVLAQCLVQPFHDSPVRWNWNR